MRSGEQIMPQTTFLESFNAKLLQPDQVAETFVPSVHFDTLCKRAHTIVIGPRGSGKTTLLKMLQPEALQVWNHPEAKYYQSKIDYASVFIGTDKSWMRQLVKLASVETPYDYPFTRSAILTYVLHQVVSSIISRCELSESLAPYLSVRLTPQDEASICQKLADVWSLSPASLSFRSLKSGLSHRQIKVAQAASAAASSVSQVFEAPDNKFLFLPFIETITHAIELFNDTVSEPTRQWALLFDELEIAPGWFTKEILDLPRSNDPRLLFKLSISPFTNFTNFGQDAMQPMAGHDFDVVDLWYPRKSSEIYSFCTELFSQVSQGTAFELLEPEEALGASAFESEADNPHGRAFEAGSYWHKQFSSLASKDKSFLEYLKKEDIDVGNMDKANATVQASAIRKVSNLVIVRNEFRSSIADVDGDVKSRSRKAISTIYSGARTIFELVEGNPRWFIGILSPLLRSKDGYEIPPSRQMREVHSAITKFRALLMTIPSVSGDHSRHGILALLDKVGEEIYKKVVIEPFSDDPPGSFRVDLDIDDEVALNLGRALNAGGIVWVRENDDELLLDSVKGKRFRLSHLLAPYYQIPVRLMSPTSLKAMLRPDDYHQSVFQFEDHELVNEE